MIKVSVIVPIYNVEEYLEQCLDSLCGQTLKDIEIILVNDASPDRSDRIMERYRKRYDNIKTIYLPENRSVGGARNAGIEIATGKYLCFVDSDDWVDSDYLEKMYQTCEETGSDFAYGVYYDMSEDGKKNGNRYFIYPKEFSGELTHEKKRAILHRSVTPWGRLFSTKLWKKIGLTFPEHILAGEDLATIPLYILHAKKSCVVMNSYYRYRIRKTSVTRTKHKSYSDRLKYTSNSTLNSTLIFIERMKKYGFYEEYLPEIEYFMVKNHYSQFLKKSVTLYEEIPYDLMKEKMNTISNAFPDYERKPNYFIFSAEERMRMMMNQMSPYACALWEKKYKDEMARDEELYPRIYFPFYEEKKDIVKKILGAYTKKVGFFGDRHKRKALSWLFEKYFPAICVTEFETEQELADYDFSEIDMLIGVNPSVCLPLHEIKEKKQHEIKVVNLEDVLLGFFEA